MKTIFSRLVCLLMLASLTIAPLSAQDTSNLSVSEENTEFLFGNVYVEDLKNEVDLYNLDEKTITVDYLEARDDEYTIQEVLTAYMFAFGIGLAFSDGDTAYCLHANVFFRLAMFTASALYGGLGLVYDGLSADSFTQNLFGVAGYLLMFSALTKYKEVFLIYGLKALYGFGKQDFDGDFEYDITQFTLSAMIGFMFMLSPAWSIALYTPIVTYLSLTQKYDGDEFKDDNTFFTFNKGAVALFSLVYRFGPRNRAVEQ